VRNKKAAGILLMVIGVMLVVIFYRQNRQSEEIVSEVTPVLVAKKREVGEPIGEFEKRITKKFFGTYVTPNNSPVIPERFRGYHTGVDVEYADVEGEVEVRAVAKGEVLVSRNASGYGGVMVIEHEIRGEKYFMIYGHLQQKSMLKVGEKVENGEKIGILGKGYSLETDGERRHLHFGISKTNNIRGYSENEAELKSNWIDPVVFILHG